MCINVPFDVYYTPVSIEAVAGTGITQVTFYVDGVSLGTFSSQPYQVWWQLKEGQHQFWVEGVTANGEAVKSDVVRITVVNK